MIDIRKILVGVDFSEHSEAALRYGAEFAKSFGAELLVCHVVPRADMLSQLPPGGEAYFPPNLAELQQQEAQQRCEELLASTGLSRGRIVLSEGSPFVELIRIARTESADLLIIGTHGRGAIAHMLLGSVAERVVRKAPCPVLVVRKEEHDFIKP
jgi:nucleotide-binding universal stress UspA family protein